MRIHDIDIYTSRQILAFIEYMKVCAEERKQVEDTQYNHTGTAGIINAANSSINMGAAKEAAAQRMSATQGTGN